MTGRILATVIVFLLASTAAAQDPVPNPFGIGWGGGFAFSSNLIGVPLVDPGDAFIDENGIIRITHPRNVKARVLLESHYTFRLAGSPLALGPVIFVQPSGESLFDAAGGGLLLELGEGPTSFNLIVGILIDFDVSRLHRDYVDGFRSPTPDLVYVQREEVQLMIGFAMSMPNF